MEQKRDGISLRQLSAVIWAAVLAPAVGLLPGVTAERAGQGSWLAVLLALPVVLLLSRMVWRLTDRGKENLAQAYCRVLGAGPGRLLAIIYIVWGVVLLALRLRLAGQRLLFTGSRDGTLWFFLPAILAAVLWLAWGKLTAFARAAELFFGILALVLGVVTLLTVPGIRPESLWPLWTQDVLPVCSGVVPVLGTLCCGIYGGFLLDGIAPPKGKNGRWTRRTVYVCLWLAAVQLTIVGRFGAALTVRLEDPFLSLAGQVGVEGAFQRVESLVSALLVYSDLTALALLLWTGRRILKELCPRQAGKSAAVAGAALALAGAALWFEDGYSAREFARNGAPAGNLILGLLVPAAVFGVDRIRKRADAEHTSCGENR